MKLLGRTATSAVILCGALAPVHAASLDRFHSFAQFSLWSDTLELVQGTLGPARVFKTGDAASSETSVCYMAHNAFVTFYSGEMGGGIKLEGVEVSKELPRGKQCAKPKNPTRMSSIEMDGLRLGMTRAEFAVVAPPGINWSGAEATSSEVAQLQNQAASANSGSTMMVTTVGAEFRRGRVVRFYVSVHSE